MIIVSNKYLIALDDGHGMNTAGKETPNIAELGRRIKENEFNRAVVALLDKELKRCGFETVLVAPTDADTPLKARTDKANKANADAYISIHFNAFRGTFEPPTAEGITVYVYNGHINKEAGKLAGCIAKYLKQGTKQKFRRISEANFHVLRETKMIAVLTENGFMDNKREALLMIDEDFQKEVAREHCQGICDYFGVAYVAEKQEEQKGANGNMAQITYTVKTNDNLSTIASNLSKEKGVNINWLDIAKLNNIKGPDYTIFKGQVLKVELPTETKKDWQKEYETSQKELNTAKDKLAQIKKIVG